MGPEVYVYGVWSPVRSLDLTGEGPGSATSPSGDRRVLYYRRSRRTYLTPFFSSSVDCPRDFWGLNGDMFFSPRVYLLNEGFITFMGFLSFFGRRSDPNILTVS